MTGQNEYQRLIYKLKICTALPRFLLVFPTKLVTWSYTCLLWMDRKTSGAEVDHRQLCITVKPYFNLANEVHFDAVRFRCRNYRGHNFNTLFLNPRLQVNLWLRQRRNYLWSSVDLAFWELTSITVYTTTYNINFLLKKNLKLLQRGNDANTFCGSCRGKFRYIIEFTFDDNLEWLVAIYHWDFSTNPVVSDISRHIYLSLKWSVCGGTHIHY